MDIEVDGKVIATNVEPFTIELPALAVESLPFNFEGLEDTGPITINGRWDASGNVEPTMSLTVQSRHLPRRAKKWLQKLTDGRPMGRRERHRGIRVMTCAGIVTISLPQ